MTQYTDFVKLHMAKLDKSIPAKERFRMIAKMWQESKPAGKEVVKAVKADKPVKAKAVKAVKAKASKAKGGALVDMHELSDDDDDEQALPSVYVIEKLKANTIKRGGYQGFQGHYPDAINESVMQQLVKKR